MFPVWSVVAMFFLFFVLIDVVKDALQPNFQLVEDSRLRALAQDLPAVLLKSKSTNQYHEEIREGLQCMEKVGFTV